MRGELSELQRLHQSNARLNNENAKLRERIQVLESENKQLKQQLEKAFLMIEDLQRMVFGKHKKKDQTDHHDNDQDSGTNQRTPTKRSSSAYRRGTPAAAEVTHEERHTLQQCPHCKQRLSECKELEFFAEDIVPPEEWYRVLKRVTRLWITTGYCSQCQKRVTPIAIPKQKTTLGEQIKSLIVFQATVQQFSYAQIIEFAESILHLKISEGEIVNILESQSVKLEPSYRAIQQTLRTSPAVHLDETGWPTPQGIQGHYAWVAADTCSDTVLYRLGQSRGQGNITALLGEHYTGIGITDDYNGYKNAFQPGSHALCWAHPHRKLRDLKDADTLSTHKQQHCQEVFTDFSALYEKVREVNAQPFILVERKQAVVELGAVFDHIIQPHELDPLKLKQIKQRLQEQKECYFVCLLHPHVSPDNNRAERALRHLVLKRKKSFGSKTQKGADMLSIIYSVVMSLWRTSKPQFFQAYRQAVQPLA